MEDLEKYKNIDGTFTSPKNGKTYQSLKSFRSHWFYAGTTNPTSFAERLYDVSCQFCQDQISISNIKKHEQCCYLNPANTTFCKVCGETIKNYRTSKGTCSRSCANVLFRSGKNNGSYKGTHYTQICFNNHKKECIVCGENKIVAVHHNDHNHLNDDPANLIPLCPTHHQYVHSKYKDEIQPIIDRYIDSWLQAVA